MRIADIENNAAKPTSGSSVKEPLLPRDTSSISSDPLAIDQRQWLIQISTVFLKCQQYQKALPLLKLLASWYPNDLQILTKLALAHYLLDEFEAALLACEKCQKMRPQSISRHLNLLCSLCYLKTGQPKEARRQYHSFYRGRKNHE